MGTAETRDRPCHTAAPAVASTASGRRLDLHAAAAPGRCPGRRTDPWPHEHQPGYDGVHPVMVVQRRLLRVDLLGGSEGECARVRATATAVVGGAGGGAAHPALRVLGGARSRPWNGQVRPS